MFFELAQPILSLIKTGIPYLWLKLALEPLKDRMSVIRSIGNVSVESKFKVGEICKRISNEPVESDHLDQKQKLPLSDHFNLVPFQGPLRKTNNIFTGILTLRLVAVVCQASRKGQKLNAVESVIQVLEGLGSSQAHFPMFWNVHSWAFPVRTQTTKVALGPLTDLERPELWLPQRGWASKPATHHENYALFPHPDSALWHSRSLEHQRDPQLPAVTVETEPRGEEWESLSQSSESC